MLYATVATRYSFFENDMITHKKNGLFFIVRRHFLFREEATILFRTTRTSFKTTKTKENAFSKKAK